MRKYTRIWNALKRDGTVAITAPPPYHYTIIRMVSKEKNQDYAWKLMYQEANPVSSMPRLEYEVDGPMITFKLKVYRHI